MPWKEASIVDIFQPSLFLAIFPYAFIASFPVFGIALVTKWVWDDRKRRN